MESFYGIVMYSYIGIVIYNNESLNKFSADTDLLQNTKFMQKRNHIYLDEPFS